VNKTHLDFVQLQEGKNETMERIHLDALQQYGSKFRASLHQLTNALQSSIEIGSYMVCALGCHVAHLLEPLSGRSLIPY
jgi:hypothetical protein